MQTYSLVRVMGRHSQETEKVLKSGLSLQRAQELKEMFASDMRTSLMNIQIREEEPAAPAAAPSRRTLTAAELQDARTARAMREMADYTLRAHDGSWIVESPEGNGYLVSATSCTCLDWEHRCSKVNAACKHMVFAAHTLFALGAVLEPNTAGPSSPADLARPERLPVAA